MTNPNPATLSKEEKIALGAKKVYGGLSLKESFIILARGYYEVAEPNEIDKTPTQLAGTSLLLVVIAAQNGDDPEMYPADFVTYYWNLTDAKLAELNREVRK